MPDQITLRQELENIKRVLQKYPNGAFIEDIEKHSEIKLTRRTLQRRLVILGNAGEVYKEGKTFATRYFLTEGKNTPVSTIPLSVEGKEILQFVTRPLPQRIRVGYSKNFLDDYQPNVSAYLASFEIEKLAKISKIIMPGQLGETYTKEILSRLLIDLSWNSSRLEGNTYSLLDTQRLIAFGERAENKSITETQMILNHKDAIEFLAQPNEDMGFNRYTILNLHALLSNDLLPDPHASGRLRIINVGIYKSVYEPLAVPQLVSELFDVILAKTEKIKNPFEQAFFVMIHLPYLQPFDDVNKHVSRLAANIPFIRNNLAPLSFIDVPEDIYIHGLIGVYEVNRVELLKDIFLWAYERSASRYAALRQELGEPDPFRLKYREEMRTLINDIVSQVRKPKEASALLKAKARELPAEDQEKFIITIESELLSLHEGNFARYRIRPSEFQAWKKIWLPK